MLPLHDPERITKILDNPRRVFDHRRRINRFDFEASEMTKREKLHEWLMQIGEWVYLNEVPYSDLSMSMPTCSTALLDFCKQGRAEFRVVGRHQYRGIPSAAIKPGPKPPKGRL